jgi:tol-pal system protein YbgF
MTYRRLAVLPLLLLLPAAGFAANREMQELQRDLGLLQQAVQQLQRSHDEKLATLTEIARQAADASAKANTALAVIESNLRQSLRDQEKNVVAPVVGLGSKMDQMANDFRTVQQSVGDLTSLMAKLQAQMTDLSNAVKIMQAPPPPPPGGPLGSGSAAPPMPASDLYTNALRDKNGGKIDLALQGFADYLRFYGNTELAPNAQFYIAEIHYAQGDLENALKEYDMVLEKYPDNNKTPDALYMKGMTLVKMGRRTQGSEEFKELNKRFPNSDVSKKGCSQLMTMGLRCGSTPRTAVPAKKKK